MTAAAPAPAISVVVPALNEARVIEQTLACLGPWREAGDEVLVVDGGSTDDTVSRARPLADRVLTAPRGRARQMNVGAAAARGRLIVFVHADTSLDPACRAALVQACDDQGALWGRFDVRLSGSARVFRLIETMINLRSRLSGIATGDQAIFVDSDLFRRVGGYPEIALMEDVALSRTLRRCRRPSALRPAVVTSSRRWEQRGILRTVVTMWILRGAYAAGVSPERLARWYR